MIINYAKNMTMDDLKGFVLKNNFNVSDEELLVIYSHIKSNADFLLDDPVKYIKMLKGKISDDNYYQMLMLFDKYRGFIGI